MSTNKNDSPDLTKKTATVLDPQDPDPQLASDPDDDFVEEDLEGVEDIDLTDELDEDSIQALFDAMADDDFDVVDAITLEAEAAHDAKADPDKPGGNAQTLRTYWVRGKGAAKIRWGTKGDFSRCVRLVSKYMPRERAKRTMAWVQPALIGAELRASRTAARGWK